MLKQERVTEVPLLYLPPQYPHTRVQEYILYVPLYARYVWFCVSSLRVCVCVNINKMIQ